MTGFLRTIVHGNIDRRLKRLSVKISKGKLTRKEQEWLVDIVHKHPCHLKATLALIRAAWSPSTWDFEPWTYYYAEALQREPDCWNNHDMIKILSLGGELFGYDDEDEKAVQANLQAFERDPQNWELLNSYIYEAFRFLDETEIVAQAKRLTQLEHVDASRKFYGQASVYTRMADRFRNVAYKAEAISYYRMALENGLEAKHPRLARAALKMLAELEAT